MFFSLASYCELGNGMLRGAPTASFFVPAGFPLFLRCLEKPANSLVIWAILMPNIALSQLQVSA